LADTVTAIPSFLSGKKTLAMQRATPLSVRSVVLNALSVRHRLSARKEGSYPSTLHVALAVAGLGISKSFPQAR
jgi:hypothetical protein